MLCDNPHMAKLKAHGAELARFEYPGCRVVVMEDGHILRNQGDGFKRYRKVIKGTPEEAAAKRRASYNARMAACPSHAVYIKMLAREFSLKNRWQVDTTVSMMPNDADGVWSTLDDHGIHCDVDTLVVLCRNYVAGEAELADYRRALARRKEMGL